MPKKEFLPPRVDIARPRCWQAAVVTVALTLAWPLAAAGESGEEIQGADPAAPGHFQVEQRFGYETTEEPAIPGTPAARKSQRDVNGESEISYSPTDWYEIALTTPFAYERMNDTMVAPGAVPGYALQSGGFTIRQTFLESDREEKTVFFGVALRVIFTPPGTLTPDLFVQNKQDLVPGAPTSVEEANPRVTGMITPIVGAHLGDDYDLIFNANFEFALGTAGSAFEPAIRIVKHLNDKWTIGIEHFANFGPIDHWLPVSQTEQTTFVVAGTKIRGFELGFGLGYGLTPAFRGLALKSSIGYDF